jgi:hypothetical protein
MTTHAHLTTHAIIIARLRAAGITRRIAARRAYQARVITADVLRPLVPAGTCGWLVHPDRGESVRAYAERALWYAAAASAWAGGLADGTQVVDPAVIASVAGLLRRGA